MTEENPIDAEARRKSRTNLLMIAGIAFVPLIMAYLMYFYFPQFAPTETTNKGTLIDPPVYFEELDLDGGQWTLVVVAPETCGSACTEALYLSRQIDVGLGKDDGRVNRLLVLAQLPEGELAQLLAEDYQNLDVREVPREFLDRLVALLPAGMIDGAILLADPNGNLMMYYTREQGGEELRSDLKHLLRLSNIG